MKSCIQRIESVLGREHYIGNRQIVIEAHERASWLIAAIDNLSWPQPPALYLSLNGKWQTTFSYHDWHSNKQKAKEHFNRFQHLLPEASALLEQQAAMASGASEYKTAALPRLELIMRLIKASAQRLRLWTGIAERYFSSPWLNR